MIDEIQVAAAEPAPPRSIGLDGANSADKSGVSSFSEPSPFNHQSSATCVALLTGGGDKPYALGLAAALSSKGISLDFIGSDDLSVPELLNDHRVNFLNLRGDQRSEASPVA